MARPLRLHFPGGIYHVTARGNDRQPIFRDDDDCARFFHVLASTATRYHVRCHAYCLMGNHYHLLLETPEANLSAAMRQLNGVYAQRFNRRHERCGHLLQGRFAAQLVDVEGYFLEVCRYIVLNPVRAGLVAHPRQWRWSSFGPTAGEAGRPPFLAVDLVQTLAGAGFRGETRYVDFVEAGIRETEALLERPRSAAGDGGLVAGQTRELRHTPLSSEIPRAQRFAGRPTLVDLFAGVTSKAERNVRVLAAVEDHGYMLSEVATFLRCHYATVSRIVSGPSGRSSTQEMSYFKT
jgi:REP element-mobilizing transposase RayT